jgi:hypothetical protein
MFSNQLIFPEVEEDRFFEALVEIVLEIFEGVLIAHPPICMFICLLPSASIPLTHPTPVAICFKFPQEASQVVFDVHTAAPYSSLFSCGGQVLAGVVLVAVDVVFIFVWLLAALLQRVRRVEVVIDELM